MKKIQPQLKELREKYANDSAKLQSELVTLYEKENVNPMAGCLPIVVQIPIFFALYKVLSVTIEMRQAPFFGWVHDLSAQDPTTAFNLFGLIHWTPPAFLPMLGGWSCLMLVAMILQQRLSPTPQDPSQQTVQSIMPFFVTLAMSYSPAGLVIYWTFSNSFSIFQQWLILRSQGVNAKIFHSKEDKEMARMVRKGPKIHPELAVVEDEVGKALTGEELPKPVTPPTRRRKTKR